MTGSGKKPIEIGIIVIAVLVLLVRGFQITMAKKNSENRAVVDLSANFNLESAKRTLSGIGGLREKRDYLEKYLRDIFQRPDELVTLEQKSLRGGLEEIKGVTEEEKFVLTGIMFGASEGNIAIISGKVVREGDMLGGAKVEKIGRNRVILLKNGVLQELKR